MSRRSLDFLLGMALLAVLASKAALAVGCGVLFAWWSLRNQTRDIEAAAAARAAMLGGVAAYALALLIPFGVTAVSSGAQLSELVGELLLLGGLDPKLTSLTVFVFGVRALVVSFLLGVSIRLMAPALPR